MEYDFFTLEIDGSEAEWLKNFLANIPLGMKQTTFVSINFNLPIDNSYS